jgi:uncharacterized ferredoxin-like protein
VFFVVWRVVSGEIDAQTAETEAILEVAKLMLVSARTAPKSGGVDDVLALVVSGERKNAIAREMELIGEDRRLEGKTQGFNRDAENVKGSEAVILIGVRGTKSFGLDCGACGYRTCKEFQAKKSERGKDFVGPTCLFKALDLGTALGSAVKMASMLNVDNRIMYRVGTAALRLRMLPEASVIMGIPVSAKGKSIFFDRK